MILGMVIEMYNAIDKVGKGYAQRMTPSLMADVDDNSQRPYIRETLHSALNL